MLQRQEVESIYMIKIKLLAKLATQHDQVALATIMRGKSGPLASRYGVCPRTIRDIWNRKTWSYETEHLWPLENEFSSRICKNQSSRCISLANIANPDETTDKERPAWTSQPGMGEDTFAATTEPVKHESLIESMPNNITDVRWLTVPEYLQTSTASVDDVLMDHRPIISATWEDPFHQDWLHW